MSIELDDDSENDSDYNPNDEPGEVSDGEKEEVSLLQGFSSSRKRKVNELWDSMVTEDTAAVSALMKKSNGSTARSSNISSSTTKKKVNRLKRNEDILASIFGKCQAKNIVRKSKIEEDKPATSSAELKSQIEASLQKIQRRTKVTEVRKFAGKDIIVNKTVLDVSSNKKQQASSSSSSSLDAVLETLKGPKVLSTVTKSSMDWDNFKEKEGLEDDLAAASKDGYLARKDFLGRCDLRAFENERDARQAKAPSAI